MNRCANIFPMPGASGGCRSGIRTPGALPCCDRAMPETASRLPERGQRGQALAEGVLGLAVLAVLFWAIPLIGRYQDLALQSAHASRYAAFLLARHPFDASTLRQRVGEAYFARDEIRWRDASGEALLGRQPDVRIQAPALAGVARPGSGRADSARLLEDWRIGDDALVAAAVRTPARNLVAFAGLPGSDLVLARRTAILVGAGHASDDGDAQARVRQGGAGWRQAAEQSVAAGQEVAAALSRIDQGWGRAPAGFEWLDAWQGLVPADRLREER